MTASTPSLPTFDQLCALEPGLQALRGEAASPRLKEQYAADEEFCANLVWAKQLKPKLQRLVGWHRQHDEHSDLLGGHIAFDVAFNAIYNQLPACRERCGCL